MKALPAILCLVLTLAQTNGAEPNPAPPAKAHPVPTLELLSEIKIGAGTGWWLRIFSDGSGRMGYGSHFPDSSPLPKGAFDFEQLYRLLTPVVQPEAKAPDSFTVFFRQRGATPTFAHYTKRSDLVLPLFETAQQKCGPFGRERVLELWQSRPPKSRE
jgi:hypothetical protein